MTSKKCLSVCKLPHAEQEEKVRSLELCFRCLEKKHISKGCKHKCSKCRDNHNALFFLKDQPKLASNSVTCRNDSVKQVGESAMVSFESNPIQSSVNHVGIALCNTEKGHEPFNSTCCVLQTAKVKVGNGEGKSVKMTVLFDTGSDRSYESSFLVKKKLSLHG